MNKILLILCLFLSVSFSSENESSDKKMLRSIYDEALDNGQAYDHLRDLCLNIGARLSGSPEAAEAVAWAEQVLKDYNFDKVYLQEVMVPHWVRGEMETAQVILNDHTMYSMDISALGGSVSTNGILEAEMITVYSIEELAELGNERIAGKIVFFNRPMDQKLINTFHSYSGCVDQRSSGAAEAAVYGAVGMVVRSMNTRTDDFPHTGATNYKEGGNKIPAAAISTSDADALEKLLIKNPSLKFSMELHCELLPDVLSYNVIAEIKGAEFPQEIILVGGHLDSWDMGHGAHDDGAGCVQSMEVLRIFKTLGYKPKRTIRCVLFMNEENGAKGAIKYAEISKEKISEASASKQEIHIAAIESDRGGFSPRGFYVDGIDSKKQMWLDKIAAWKDLFKPYDVHFFELGFSGVDVNFLKDQGFALIGFVPDSQRYFDHHHSDFDTFDQINKRELHLGAATMTSLVYLIDQHGL